METFHILDNGRTIEKPIPIVTFDRDETIGSTNDTLLIATHSAAWRSRFNKRRSYRANNIRVEYKETCMRSCNAGHAGKNYVIAKQRGVQ